jgi:thiamine pyrophosphokinase
MNKRCAILCTAPTEFTPDLLREIRACDLLFCGDAGVRAAGALGLTPDLIVGDFDSYAGALPEGVPVLRLPVEKDYTDSFVCMQQALERGCDFLLLTGVLGGRLDHSMANIQSLRWLREQGARGVLADGRNTVFLLQEEEVEIPRRAGWKLSVFAMGGDCVVSLSGVKYPLSRYTLTGSFPLGVSNEFLDGPAGIAVHSGTLLVILAREGPAEGPVY